MRFKLEFDCDTAAFETYGLRGEVAEVLAKVAQALRDGREGGSCRDSHGNTVGSWELA